MRSPSKAQEIRVGIVTVVAIVVLIGGLLWGQRIGVGVETRLVRFHFPTAAGVEVGTPLTLNGVRSGDVTAVKTGRNGVEVTATINFDEPLYTDAAASIRMLEITGGKRIELDPGNSGEPLPPNAVVPGTSEGDIGALVAVAGDLGAKADTLLGRIDSALTLVTDIVGTPEFKRDVTVTLDNVRESSTILRSFLVRNNAKLQQTVDDLVALTSEARRLIDENGPTITRTVSDAEMAVADVRELINSVDGTLHRADSLIAQLDAITGDVRNGNGLVTRLLYDDDLAERASKALTELREFIEQLRRHGINTNVRLGTQP